MAHNSGRKTARERTYMCVLIKSPSSFWRLRRSAASSGRPRSVAISASASHSATMAELCKSAARTTYDVCKSQVFTRRHLPSNRCGCTQYNNRGYLTRSDWCAPGQRHIDSSDKCWHSTKHSPRRGRRTLGCCRAIQTVRLEAPPFPSSSCTRASAAGLCVRIS